MDSRRNRASQKQTVSSDSDDADGLSLSDRKELVKETLMHILSQEASKVPTKRVSIVKSILQRHSKNFRTIMLEVKNILSLIFGYQLMESDGKYFLKNKFQPSELGLKILREPKEHRKRCTLLMLVLSLIFMEGGSVREDVVWNFLVKLKIKVMDMPDPVFGDVKKVLAKDFVSMLYLQHSRREGTDPPVYEFSSGVRAEVEIPKRKLLEFVCKMYGNSENSWPVQLRQVEVSEGTEAQDLSQLVSKRMRLSQPSQQSSSQRRPRSPQPGPSSRR